MQIGVKQAKDQLSQLILRAAAGDEITITRRGVPIARMLAAEPKPGSRKLGMDKGRGWIADDFDAPLKLVEDQPMKKRKKG